MAAVADRCPLCGSLDPAHRPPAADPGDLGRLAAEVEDELAVRIARAVVEYTRPAELDPELTAYVREQAAHGQLIWRWQIGHPVKPLYLESRLIPDGSIELRLLDWYAGAPRWTHTIRPASPAAPPAGEPNPATSGRRSRGHP